MARRIRRFLACLLSFVLMVGVVPQMVLAKERVMTKLIQDEPRTVTGHDSDDLLFYTFQPETDGWYLFSVTECDGFLPDIWVYDEPEMLNMLEFFNGEYCGANYCQMEGGKVYGIPVRCNGDDFQLTVKRELPILWIYGEGGTLPGGDSALMSTVHDGDQFLSDVLAREETFVRDGYQLIGWNSYADKTIADADSIKLKVHICGDINAYSACWARLVSVTFHGCGAALSDGMGETVLMEAAEGQLVRTYDDVIQKFDAPEGKAFLGWALSENAETSDGEALISENLDLYAVWGDAATPVPTNTPVPTSTPTPTQNLATPTLKVSDLSTNASASKAQRLALSLQYRGDGELSFASDNARIKVNEDGEVTIPKDFAGTATITVKSSATDRYKAAEATAKITVIRIANKIMAEDVAMTASTKPQAFSLAVTQKGKGKLTFSSNTPSVQVTNVGKVTVAKNFSGRAKITIKSSAAGAYKAASRTIIITVKPAKITSGTAKNLAGGKIALAWKKAAGAAGYQIVYSTTKDFKSKKSVTTKNTKATISKLAKGKTYYVKIRAYKKDVEGNLFSAWASFKAVKVTK